MRQNTKERTKIETVYSSQLVYQGIDKHGMPIYKKVKKEHQPEVTKESYHRMEGLGRVYESLVDQMVIGSIQEHTVDEAIVRQYSTVASKKGKKEEEDNTLKELKKS